MARWPGWVYGTGEEPDYRFSLANERTLLAWLRTSLALLAAGVAVDSLDLGLPGGVGPALAILLTLLGLACAVGSWVRWARSERAIRRGEPLPASSLGLLLTAGVGLVAAVLVLAGV
ncbi:MAG: hypothetical protein CMH83_07705 [Nocardioides sp.]|nr:hypothetical protein [Nocardioides sp.]